MLSVVLDLLFVMTGKVLWSQLMAFLSGSDDQDNDDNSDHGVGNNMIQVDDSWVRVVRFSREDPLAIIDVVNWEASSCSFGFFLRTTTTNNKQQQNSESSNCQGKMPSVFLVIAIMQNNRILLPPFLVREEVPLPFMITVYEITFRRRRCCFICPFSSTSHHYLRHWTRNLLRSLLRSLRFSFPACIPASILLLLETWIYDQDNLILNNNKKVMKKGCTLLPLCVCMFCLLFFTSLLLHFSSQNNNKTWIPKQGGLICLFSSSCLFFFAFLSEQQNLLGLAIDCINALKWRIKIRIGKKWNK